MEAGRLVAWKKQPGETVRRGEIVADVETDKGVIAVEAFNDGVFEQILVPPGAEVPVGTVLALIRGDDEPAARPIRTEGPDVIVSGEQRLTRLAQSGRVVHWERTHGRFSRRIRLDHPVDVARAEIGAEHGVVYARLPKSDARRPTSAATTPPAH